MAKKAKRSTKRKAARGKGLPMLPSERWFIAMLIEGGLHHRTIAWTVWGGCKGKSRSYEMEGWMTSRISKISKERGISSRDYRNGDGDFADNMIGGCRRVASQKSSVANERIPTLRVA